MTKPALLLISLLFSVNAWALGIPGPGDAKTSTIKLPDGPGSVRGLSDTPSTQEFTGQLSYSVPIDLPAGIGGIAPKLALGYAGELGNGPLGIGWGLSGSSIRRSLAHGIPRFDDSDHLELNGLGFDGRLIAISPTEYRVEGKANSVRVFKRGQGFEVRAPDGSRILLGTTPESRLGPDARIAAWHIDSIETLTGQKVRFEYATDQGQVYLTGVIWGPDDVFRVGLAYGERYDPVISFLTGSKVVTARRLTTVTVRSFGEVLRTYNLTYDESFAVSRLASIRMTGRGGEGALPTLRFQYQGKYSPQVEQHGNAQGWNLGNSSTALVDIDNDGLPDLVRMDGFSQRYLKNLGDSFDSSRTLEGASSIELGQSRLMDLDGDTKTELVRIVNDTWRKYELTGTTWSAGQEWPGTQNVPLRGDAVTLVDLNGDGILDTVQERTEGIAVRFGTTEGLGPVQYFGAVGGDLQVEPGAAAVRFHDVNGDGLADVLYVTDQWVKVFLGHGDGTFEPYARWDLPAEAQGAALKELFFADLNRDGLLDLIRVSGTHVYYFEGRVGGFVSTPVKLARPESVDLDAVLSLGDLNGNGSQDVIWSSPRGIWGLDLAGATTAGMLVSIDNGMGKETRISYSPSAQLSAQANRDGKPWASQYASSIPVVTRVETVLSPLEPSRVTLHNVRDPFWDPVDRKFGGFQTAVSTVPGTTPEQTLVTTTEFLPGLGGEKALRGKAWRTRQENGAGTLLGRTEAAWQVHAVPGLPDVPEAKLGLLLSEHGYVYDGASDPVETLKEIQYDDDGHPIREINHGRTDLSGDESYVERRFASDDSTGVRDVICEEVVRDFSDGSIVSDSRTYYGDAITELPLCQIGKGWKRRTSALLGNRWIDRGTMEYDVVGNPVRITENGVTREIGYDAPKLHPESETLHPSDGVTLRWTVAWDEVSGTIASAVDPNGDVSRFTYDLLGRLSATARNDAAPQLLWKYNFETTRPTIVRYDYDGPTGSQGTLPDAWTPGAHWRETTVVYNGAGEEQLSALRLDSSRWIVSNFLHRDARGKTDRVFDAFYSERVDPEQAPAEARSQTLAYDAQGRVVQQTLPNGGVRSALYDRLKVTETADDLVSVTRQTDGQGRIFTTERTVGGVLENVVAKFHPLGAIAELNVSGKATHRFEYDSLGRMVFATDPDIGDRHLEYDDGDRLRFHRNGEGETVEIRYDAIARPTEILGEKTRIVYGYDTPLTGSAQGMRTMGRIAWVEDPGPNESRSRATFQYDEQGRVIRSERTIGDSSVAESLSFTPSGLQTALETSDGFSASFSYDAAGRLTQIPSIWEGREFDASGRILGERYGNGVEQVTDYDAVGLPQRVQIGSGGRPYYDATVSRNHYGAITRIQDNYSGGLDHNAVFQYDGAGRLTGATMGSGTEAYQFGYRYDTLQNMVERTASGPRALAIKTGAYRYGENGAGPRQLTSIVPDATQPKVPVKTLAGGGSQSDRDGDALQAKLVKPMGVAVARSGLMYVSDAGMHRIYSLDRSGILRRIAGGEQAGFGGDGGPANGALLNQPGGLFVGKDGETLYVADTGNNRIRRISKEGVIETIASGLNRPTAVVEGSDGGLYVADAGSHSVKVIRANGAIETYADGVDEPVALAFGADGALYVADAGGHRVVKVAVDRQVSEATVAGLKVPSGVAVGADGAIYVSDREDHRIWVVRDGVTQGYAGTGVAGNSGDQGEAVSAQIGSPEGLVLGPEGVLYVAQAERLRAFGPEFKASTYKYDHAGRNIESADSKLVFDGFDRLVRVDRAPVGPATGWAAGGGSVEYGYGYDGLRTYTQHPDGSIEKWYSANVRERDGVRSYYVSVGSRLVAKVTRVQKQEAVAGRGSAEAARVGAIASKSVQGLLALMLLGGGVMVVLRREGRLKTAFASVVLVGYSGWAIGCAGGRAGPGGTPGELKWGAGETTYFHTGFTPGPFLQTDADGKVLEERRNEPFGTEIDAFRRNGVGIANLVREPKNGLNALSDESTGWSYHGARWMEPGSARWLSPDPPVKAPDAKFLVAPWSLHPYQYAAQNPVLYWDPDGREPMAEYVRGNNAGTLDFFKAVGLAVADPLRTGVEIGWNLAEACSGGPWACAKSLFDTVLPVRPALALHNASLDAMAKGDYYSAGYLEAQAQGTAMMVAATVALAGAKLSPSAVEAQIGAAKRGIVRSAAWLMDSRVRGLALESEMGANLAVNFPVIDRWLNGVATSIKTINLEDKSYAKMSGLTGTLRKYVRDVAGFDGGAGYYRDGTPIVIRSSEVVARELHVGIPAGSMTPERAAALEAIVEYGKDLGVRVYATEL